MARLPPCKKNLYPHTRRTNYTVAVWKRAHINKPEIPSPSESHGWILNQNTSILEPIWSDGDILPQQLIDILQAMDSDDESDEEISSDRNDPIIAVRIALTVIRRR